MKIIDENVKPDTRNLLNKTFMPGGKEPDPRFSLANERTFLAWVRTSLALMAGAIALDALPLKVNKLDDIRSFGPDALTILGMLTILTGLFRWYGTEKAMRHSRPLNISLFIPAITIIISTAGAYLIFSSKLAS